VDWQIWIEQGEKPVPRKVVITYKELPARPQTRRTCLTEPQRGLKDEQFVAKIPAGRRRWSLAQRLPCRAGGRPAMKGGTWDMTQFVRNQFRGCGGAGGRVRPGAVAG